MKKENLSKLLTLGLLAGLLLSACGLFGAASPKENYYYGAADAAGEGAVYLGEPAMEPQAEFAEESVAAEEARTADLGNVQAERLVIKNADVSIVVDDPAAALDDISALADELGGFVVSSNLYQSTSAAGIEYPSASITIRVPAESLSDALDRIEGQAVRVVSQSQSGQDVTSQYTDLQSRLRNLEDAEELLRQIMDEARDTEDVLNAFNQLNYITEQIEVLKGQIQYYEESAALSAISVQLIASASEQPITIGGWEPVGVAKDAIQSLIGALQGLVNAVIWIVLYVLPILLVIGIPLWLIVRGVRRWWGRRGSAKKSSK
jgi:hypothetical protein